MNLLYVIIQLCLFSVAIGIVVYLFDLLRRFVVAQEKMAASLDIIAGKLKDEGET